MLLLATGVNVSAQDKVKSVSLELFGAQNLVGVNYDSRFKGNDGFGFRVGVGFGYGDNSYLFDQDVKGVGVPVEINYLFGKGNHKLEIGFGASLGFYHVKETVGYIYVPEPGGEIISGEYTNKSNQFGYMMFGDIGYRYQRKNGFMFRVGISPSFNFGDKYGLDKSSFYPYIGFGWSF